MLMLLGCASNGTGGRAPTGLTGEELRLQQLQQVGELQELFDRS